ncbi:MAG: hypothetical protein RMJ55_09220 [Roseiflexaceae bacterium]|nr:hypothetical protein [Roseiflexaceae bacterium]
MAEVAQILITVGRRAQWIAEEARQAGMSPDHVHSLRRQRCSSATGAHAAGAWRLMLIKGSRGMFMETIVAQLQQHTP